MTKKRTISHTWEEGRVLDLWSFVHFTSGAVMGLVASFLDYSASTLFLVALLLMVLWEIFEVIVGIGESIENRVADVVIGVCAYLPVFHFAPEENAEKILVLIVLVCILAALEYLGWRAYVERISK